MLKPNFLLPQRLLRSALTPRSFPTQCRRWQANLTPAQQLLVQQNQESLPPLKRPHFEKAVGKKGRPNEPEPQSFHPALAGFFAGAMVAFTTSYLLYLYSGTYNMRRAATESMTKMNKEQDRVSGILDKKLGEISAEESRDWFYRMAMHYSAFMPNSDQYVERVKGVTQEHLQAGKEKEQKIAQIIKECAAELKQEIGSGMFESSILNGLGSGKKGWNIVMKHLERIRYLDGKLEDKKE
ncbi:hypothetical protein E6O75_ATG10914 [Venturia nashicola]|uniref:Uncharacterized protein n=1 Tax=Venturia nashicola TaxID=86259 RepID=A0A4Z1PGG5_9PEZI|nr:hypothetical protein E6O75_ATG10914 [Venturia nashicola]